QHLLTMYAHSVANFYKRNFKAILILLFLSLVLLAWFNRFIQDDAFISFRYADNFVRGWGLVWNQGERVEGYTNFLWTLIISVPLLLKLDPVKFVFVAGIILFALSLYFTYRAAISLFQSSHLALLTTLLLGTNYSFSSYATSGMDTQLQACLLVAAIWIFFEGKRTNDWSVARLLALSLVSTAAVLTRMDSLLIVGGLILLTLREAIRTGPSAKTKAWFGFYLAVPFVLLVGSWLVWKWSF